MNNLDTKNHTKFNYKYFIWETKNKSTTTPKKTPNKKKRQATKIYSSVKSPENMVSLLVGLFFLIGMMYKLLKYC